MLTRLLNIIIFCIICNFLQGQNLVPNHNFEQAWTCPQYFTIEPVKKLLPHWNNPTKGTPDYFHVCSDSIAGIPDNFAGSMYPFAGRAYVGLILREAFDSTHKNVFGISREYIQAELIKPLVKNKKYCVSLYYANASKSVYTIDALGIALTRQSINTRDAGKILQVPQIINRPGHIMQNKTGWQELCGVYRARGNERYLTIGNFFDNEQTRFVKNTDEFVDSSFIYAYYYIDDVRLFEIENHFECACNEINSFGTDMLADNYDPETGYNSLNYTQQYIADKNQHQDSFFKDDFDYISDAERDSLSALYKNIFNSLFEDSTFLEYFLSSELDSLLTNFGFDINSFFEDISNFYSLSNEQRESLLALLGVDSFFDEDGKFFDELQDAYLDSLLTKLLAKKTDPHSFSDSDFYNPYGHLKSTITDEAFRDINIGDSFTLNRIFFEFDSDELLTASYVELNKLVEILSKKENLKIEIRGHTDDVGTNTYNRRLSNNRANAVYNYLYEQSINKNRMKYIGLGSREPIADNETEKGRAKNRRVEIIIEDI